MKNLLMIGLVALAVGAIPSAVHATDDEGNGDGHTVKLICHHEGNGSFHLIPPDQNSSHLDHDGGLKHGDVYPDANGNCPSGDDDDDEHEYPTTSTTVVTGDTLGATTTTTQPFGGCIDEVCPCEGDEVPGQDNCLGEIPTTSTTLPPTTTQAPIPQFPDDCLLFSTTDRDVYTGEIIPFGQWVSVEYPNNVGTTRLAGTGCGYPPSSTTFPPESPALIPPINGPATPGAPPSPSTNGGTTLPSTGAAFTIWLTLAAFAVTGIGYGLKRRARV